MRQPFPSRPLAAAPSSAPASTFTATLCSRFDLGQPKSEGQARCATAVFLVSLFSSLVAKFDSSLTGRSAYLLEREKKIKGRREGEEEKKEKKKRRSKEIAIDDEAIAQSRLEWTQVFPVNRSAAVARSKSQLPGLGEAAFPRR